MATINELYKVALENREELNRINDQAKETEDLAAAGLLVDSDLVRVSRGGVSLQTTVGDLKSAGGIGEDNVQADWNETNGTSDAFILNKPTLLSQFVNDLPDTGGDMKKAVYDQNNDGIVDNAARLGGNVPSYYDQNAHVANAALHLLQNEKDALTNANSPTAGNPLATIADVDNLTTDQKDAIQAANAPSALNPFVTVNEITGGLTGVSKYPGNTNLTQIEVNDMLNNTWWSTTLYIKQARYNGGDSGLITSYTVIDSIEF